MIKVTAFTPSYMKKIPMHTYICTKNPITHSILNKKSPMAWPSELREYAPDKQTLTNAKMKYQPDCSEEDTRDKMLNYNYS